MTPDELVGRTLLAAACALLVGRLCSIALARVRQPQALGEILAGIVLGPTLIGSIPDGPSSWLFPPEVRAALAPIALLGLVLFMFLIGSELDLRVTRLRARTVIATSAGALLLPFALGLLLAVFLYDAHGRGDAVGFHLFVATVMSVTALPVLARILEEKGMERAPVGQIALASAAVQDGVGWMLVIASLTLGSETGSLASMLLQSAALIVGIALIARHVVERVLRAPAEDGMLGYRQVTILLSGLLLAAAAAQLIGLHTAIGAFMFGALAIPRGVAVVERLQSDLAVLARGVLLPLYFVTVGLTVDLGSISAHMLQRELGPILGCAIVGKVAGAALGARLGSAEWHEARVLGILMNTRGLMELVVLQIGRTSGVIDEQLFNLFVVMTLVTTLMTAPLLDLAERRNPRNRP